MLTFILCVLFFFLGLFLTAFSLGLGITLLANDGELVVAFKGNDGKWRIGKKQQRSVDDFVNEYLDDNHIVVGKKK